MQYNKADQLTLWPGMYSYTYYQDGSMQCVKNASGSTTLRSYDYAPAGLLASASCGGRTLANTWDADSNRVAMDANGSEYAFVYDTTAGVPAVIAEVQPDESVVYCYREPDGSLIARRDGSDWRYYHFDALGSTRLITDSYGYVADAYAYDAYGALLSRDRYSGSIDQPYQFVGRYGYYTHWMEPGFGLLQVGVRYYDPTIGRFTQIDAVRNADGPTAYDYAGAVPTVAVDPSGLIPEFPDEWWKCTGKAIGQFPFGSKFGWPNGMSKEKNCKGLSDRECWGKIVRCLVWAESKDDPKAKNPTSSARGLMQIMMSCHQDGCTKRLRAVKMIGEKDQFDWKDPCENITCGVYILYGGAMHGGLANCAKSTYTSIPGKDFAKCMSDWWPKKPQQPK